MVIHPNAGWARVIWGGVGEVRGLGWGGGGGGGGGGTAGPTSVTRTNPIKKKKIEIKRHKIVSKLLIFLLRHVYGYAYALIYGGPVGLRHTCTTH